MDEILKRIDEIVRNLFGGSVDYARDRATYETASQIERATFGRVFRAIQGALMIVMVFGCLLISNATQNQTFLQYVCGFLWILPFIVVGGLLARFRRSLFVRIRGTMNRFMGGG
jgi:hypothetical protein